MYPRYFKRIGDRRCNDGQILMSDQDKWSEHRFGRFICGFCLYLDDGQTWKEWRIVRKGKTQSQWQDGGQIGGK